MKKTILIMLCTFSLSAFAGEITVKVSGMVCSLCAQGIKKKYSEIEAVKEVKVNLDTKLVHIQTKDGMDVSDTQINNLIKEAGYNVVSIERK
ncbi:MAG: heavy-metal-associated domain-containing protein [Bacteriovoracaceae bacterium]|nr:heavy-metal-associated domain-containing protein [Bacteriovoracaceae bacterium]